MSRLWPPAQQLQVEPSPAAGEGSSVSTATVPHSPGAPGRTCTARTFTSSAEAGLASQRRRRGRPWRARLRLRVSARAAAHPPAGRPSPSAMSALSGLTCTAWPPSRSASTHTSARAASQRACAAASCSWQAARGLLGRDRPPRRFHLGGVRHEREDGPLGAGPVRVPHPQHPPLLVAGGHQRLEDAWSARPRPPPARARHPPGAESLSIGASSRRVVFTRAATCTSGKGSSGLAATVTRRLRPVWGWA